MTEFIQAGPVLLNQFEEDELLKSYMNGLLPEDVKKEITTDLKRFGQRVVSDVLLMAQSAETNPPKLVQFDPWGKRIDKVVVDSGWSDLHKVSAQEQIVKLGYERKYGAHSRAVQFAKLYLFHPSSAFYSCPLAMTDGAAKLIELYAPKELKKAFDHLTSDESDQFWTSGQWRLFGTKWFTSAITSEMSMALARIENDKGESIAGSRGLSLFYIEINKPDGSLNNIEVMRLKDKLGTKALPTAELKLVGTVATLVGNEGEGVKQISSMFNVTRLYNSVTSIAAFRRIYYLATDYSSKRQAFGKNIEEHPLNARLLNQANADFHACFYFTFLVAEIFGNEEVFDSKNIFKIERNDLNRILRLLTPVLKLYTAKRTVQWTSELLEVFGGVGYIEDSGIPTLYRDNQVFSIWEGTTNVLSLDLLRALKKDQSWPLLVQFLSDELKQLEVSETNKILQEKLKKLNDWMVKLSAEGDMAMEPLAREMAFKIADLVAAVAWLRAAKKQEKNLLSDFIGRHL